MTTPSVIILQISTTNSFFDQFWKINWVFIWKKEKNDKKQWDFSGSNEWNHPFRPQKLSLCINLWIVWSSNEFIDCILNGFEGSRTARIIPRWRQNWGIDLWWEPLKEGLSLNTSYLIQYLLTVDLRLETYFTIDSWLMTWDLLLTVDLRLETYSWQLTVTEDRSNPRSRWPFT